MITAVNSDNRLQLSSSYDVADRTYNRSILHLNWISTASGFTHSIVQVLV